MTLHKTAKPICFYLPQFHAIPENDSWWGEGFTEWTLVSRAESLFENHYQPVMPHQETGYYNLMDPGVRRRQAEMAASYGIHGFCYYHYWFRGKRLLEQPLEAMLSDGEPDLPFCLCWANEPWSRRWSGEDSQVLQSQHYGDVEDWNRHFDLLLRFFSHRNYICVDEKPMFLIYRIGHVSNGEAMIAHWRHRAIEAGLPGLHLVAIEGGFADSRIVPDYVDGLAEHQPSCLLHEAEPLQSNGLSTLPVEQLWRKSLEREKRHSVHYPGVCHRWDNTPRRQRAGTVVLPSRPERFRLHLDRLFERVRKDSQQPFVFFNGWNEWSEGAHLEPEARYGVRWLECIRDALQSPGRVQVVPLQNSHFKPLAQPESRFRSRDRNRPDIDLINSVVLSGMQASKVVEFGCRSPQSSIHLRDYLGADRYVVLDPDPQINDGEIEVGQVDLDRPCLDDFDKRSIDLIFCVDLPGLAADPAQVLKNLSVLLSTQGSIWIGFENSSHHSHLHRLLDGESDALPGATGISRRFSEQQAEQIVEYAGLKVSKRYHVSTSQHELALGRDDNGLAASLGEVRLTGLSPHHIKQLLMSRFFLVAHRSGDHGEVARPAITGWRKGFIDAVDKSVSEQDVMYSSYTEQGRQEDYFYSSERQVRELERYVVQHLDTPLNQLQSIADYACHYGRLLRTLRLAAPDARLHGYDIDPQALAFCSEHFACDTTVVGWRRTPSLELSQHDLIISASLLTHTSIDFFREVLQQWRDLLNRRGLLCFTYLGASYPAQWCRAELEHYGAIDPDVREQKAREFERLGYAFAGFDTPYGDTPVYGVGFISEEAVVRELTGYPDLEYLGTVPGTVTSFNQDLALVRKNP